MAEFNATYQRKLAGYNVDVNVSIDGTDVHPTNPTADQVLDMDAEAMGYFLAVTTEIALALDNLALRDEATPSGEANSKASGAGFEDEDAYEPEPQHEPSIPVSALLEAIDRVPGYDKFEITGPAFRALRQQAEAEVRGATSADEDDPWPLTGCGDPLCGCLN